MLVATGIDDLDLDLFAVDFKWTTKHVKYVRDVFIREGIFGVVCYQTVYTQVLPTEEAPTITLLKDGFCMLNNAINHHLDGFNSIFLAYLDRFTSSK